MSGAKHFLDGGGRATREIQEADWSLTELGPMTHWPAALKITAGTMVNSRFAKCLIWGPGLTTLHNDAFRTILGARGSGIGKKFSDIWHDLWPDIGHFISQTFAGETVYIADHQVTIVNDGHPEARSFTFCFSPVRDENGVICGILNTVIETTDKVDAERQLRLVNGELGHRIKNALAVVSAIVNQTLNSSSGPDARQTLRQRIGALADAQKLLTGSNTAEASICDVINRALAPFRGSDKTFTVTGPSVTLSAKQSLTLALAVNELATNALKYGALSVAGGHVELTWTAGMPHSEQAFVLRWCETGGPVVAAPSHQGFGSRIIEDALPQDFMGQAVLTYAPTGLIYELRATMSDLGAMPEPAEPA